MQSWISFAYCSTLGIMGQGVLKCLMPELLSRKENGLGGHTLFIFFGFLAFELLDVFPEVLDQRVHAALFGVHEILALFKDGTHPYHLGRLGVNDLYHDAELGVGGHGNGNAVFLHPGLRSDLLEHRAGCAVGVLPPDLPVNRRGKIIVVLFGGGLALLRGIRRHLAYHQPVNAEHLADLLCCLRLEKARQTYLLLGENPFELFPFNYGKPLLHKLLGEDVLDARQVFGVVELRYREAFGVDVKALAYNAARRRAP